MKRRVVVLLALAAVTLTSVAAPAFAAMQQLFDDLYPKGRVARTVAGIRFSFRVPEDKGAARWMNGTIARAGDTPARPAAPLPH